MNPLLGTVVAASIAGMFALAGLIANKESKVSEFRQQWVDALRADIAALIGILFVIEAGAKDVERATETVNMLHARIQLRFHRGDSSFVPVEKALAAVLRPHRRRPANEFKDLIDSVVDESQILLKGEWERVKRGERAYRVTVILLLLLIAGIVLSTLIYFSLHR